jgi:F0F1-type ATP synthase membrane subunit c/vacuolar-type H+-ATPase subunit K
MDKHPEERPLSIIWAAFLSSVVLYGVVGWILGQGDRAPINLEILNWVQIFLGLSSLPILLTVFLLRQLMAAVTRGSYRNYCIVRWALLETIAVFGLVQFLLGGHFEVLLIFLAVAALSIGAARPGAADRAAWEAQFR